jgi:hypothetical protein
VTFVPSDELDRGSRFCIVHRSERRAVSSGVNDGVVADDLSGRIQVHSSASLV